ncbi:MAG: PSD1 and planctomycete cytochrome C domain-containing protein, partial [Verrucomicrobiales bacterium]|nr:PSD1 and planctomycete cytochrome C domain-containing protein [Verrucomicrobiales bacterium]
FFEKRIRPVLVERCYKCHSADSEKLKGGLRLDSRPLALKGGDTRPAVVPGDPEKSLLIEAIGYANVDLQMPPKGKLSPAQIADFTTWVTMGAPWPEATGPNQGVSSTEAFNLPKRRAEHWSWQPISAPALPAIKNQRWPAQPVDHFILAKLESAHLSPAVPADKRTLVRRLYFDLIGLPPSPETVESFVRDASANAYEKIVDRLLASPQFGERWARHWLDLVRYAETLGHEFDYTVPGAWRYRDYVIRALNADVPYDQFVVEHIAGDTLAEPRRHPTERFNESLIGTGFFWLGQQSHSPVDVRQYQSDIIDNQIDVLTKTFLGVTVACARCHDHKFDAISTKDFYSLYGILSSSRYAQQAIDPPEGLAEKIAKLRSLKSEIRQATGETWQQQAERFGEYLLAARDVVLPMPPGTTTNLTKAIADSATDRQLAPKVLESCAQALRSAETAQPWHPLHAWRRLACEPPAEALKFSLEWPRLLREWRQELRHEHQFNVFADFSKPESFQNWFPDGSAFDSAPGQPGEFVVGPVNRPIGMIALEPGAHSGAVSRRLQGALRSPTFTIEQRYIHVLAAGRDTRINVCVDNFVLIRDPIYGGLKKRVNDERWHWITFDAEMWKGHRAYLELLDHSVPDLSDDARTGAGLEGHLAVSRVVFSNEKAAPAIWNEQPAGLSLLGQADIDSVETLARAYARATLDAVNAWTSSDNPKTGATKAQLALLDWLVRHDILAVEETSSPTAAAGKLARLIEEFREVESTLRAPTYVPGMIEGNGLDETVFIRGNPRSPGERVARRFIEALDGATPSGFEHGSGRAELARRVVDRSNPLLSRVMVNRVWHHLFGRGIVASTDDFGVLGQRPTHPELLDWLADWYRGDAGYSTKKLIRLLVTSATYQMSSRAADAIAEERDPNNVLWHRMPVRRLEGETIRDAMLALSGRLDATLFGAPVPIHLSPFMDGRGRPGASGPLDGSGRRTIYLEVRRNFPVPMLRAFDTPVPFTTVGRRLVSNVPAQSLILMNDPLVVGQAEIWAKRLLQSTSNSGEERVTEIYQSAFSRPPTNDELSQALTFLRQQEASYAALASNSSLPEKVWADFCHVIFNVKEFVFVH